MSPVPLILDVDTGVDDALALLYACGSADADLAAVTCLSGNAAVADTERNTRAVLELAGRAQVEVASGRPTPLIRPLEITPETHGPHGIGYAELPEPAAPPEPAFPPELLVPPDPAAPPCPICPAPPPVSHPKANTTSRGPMIDRERGRMGSSKRVLPLGRSKSGTRLIETHCTIGADWPLPNVMTE